METWTEQQLQAIDEAHELEVAAHRPDGHVMRRTPIWVVVAEREVYVRTWHDRETGWFGNARRSGRAGMRVPGVEAEVSVVDVHDSGVDAAVDEAYRAKYGSAAGSMVSEEARSTTLRLRPRA